jgi:hypothetical protein
MSPRCGASSARRSLPEPPTASVPGQCPPASARPRCARWGQDTVIGWPRPRSGVPSLCRPSSARRPSPRPKPACRGIATWPAGTTPRMHTCSAAWSVVANVNWRGRGAAFPRALTTLSAAVGRRPCGRPQESAAPHGLSQLAPWMSWCGRIGAGSCVSQHSARMHSHGPTAAHGCLKPCRPDGRLGVMPSRRSNGSKPGCWKSIWRRSSGVTSSSAHDRR